MAILFVSLYCYVDNVKIDFDPLMCLFILELVYLSIKKEYRKKKIKKMQSFCDTACAFVLWKGGQS